MESFFGILIVICVSASVFAYFFKKKNGTDNTDIGESFDETEESVLLEANCAPQRIRVKGRIWGTLGMLYMASYALYINSVINSSEVNNLGEAIGKAAAINMFSPFFYCVLVAALLAFVGIVGKSKICVLLALAATIGAVFILPGAIEMLFIPALMFLISYVRMAK